MRYLIFFTLLFLGQACYSQVIERHGLIRHSKPTYALSSDDNWLLVDDISEDNKRFSVFLNLKDWSVKTSVLLGTSRLLPDMNSSFSNYIGSYAGAEGWLAFNRFCAYYFPDHAKGTAMIQWPDKNYILGQMPDGTFMASDDFTLQKAFASTVFKGLKIMDPLTGNTVKVLHDNIAIGRKLTEYSPESKIIGNGSVVVWHKGDNQEFVTLPVNTGKAAYFLAAAPVTVFSGIYGIAVDSRFSRYGPTSEPIYNNRQLLYDMSMGQAVLDTTFKNQTGVIYSGTNQAGQIYTLNAKTGELKEQTFNGKSLVTQRQKTLELPELPLYGQLQGYDLMISAKNAKLLLIPKHWKRLGEKTNQLYAWDLNTGKLVYKIRDFFYPHESVLAAQEKEAEMWRNYKAPVKAVDNIVPGTLVKSTDGFNYVLLSFNSSTKVWEVVKLQKDRKGNYERSYTTKPAGIFTLVSNTKCTLCGGGGAMAVVRDQSSSTVDNYNARLPGGKVITTTTKQVEGTDVCSKCHGAGFEH